MLAETNSGQEEFDLKLLQQESSDSKYHDAQEFREPEIDENEFDLEQADPEELVEAMNYDYDQLREDIRKAVEEMEEPKLAASIEFAKNLGPDYPYADELEDAEKALYEMVLLSMPDPASSEQ